MMDPMTGVRHAVALTPDDQELEWVSATWVATLHGGAMRSPYTAGPIEAWRMLKNGNRWHSTCEL